MGIYVPLEMLSGILIILIALGQLVRPYKFRNLIFSLILFEMGFLHLLHLYIMYNRDSLTYYSLFLTAQPVFMSLGVLIYFYILSVKDEIQKFDRKNIRHFIPTFVSIFLILIFYFAIGKNGPLIKEQVFSRIFLNSLFVLSWISLGAYILVSIKQIRIDVKKGNPVHKVFQQLMFLLILAFPAMITGIITSMMEWPSNSPFNIIYIVLNTFIILSLFLLMQRNPYLVQYGTLPMKKKSEGKSYLANVDVVNLKNNLKIIMEEEKLYCDEDLTLPRLSEVLEVTQHQLSHFLNEHYNINFNSYINNFRINDAKEMLLNEPERSTLSIAYAVGFNSYSVFYTAFKKGTLLSPAQFRKKS